MAKRKNIDQKRLDKQALLVERTSMALNVPAGEARRLLALPLRQSARVNVLLANLDSTREVLVRKHGGTVCGWCPEGVFVPSDLSRSELVDSNMVYIQNAASWLPVVLLGAGPDDTVLDMCAAPGGKTSHIYARGARTITANDNSRARLAKLQHNMSRLGAAAEYTLHDATRLSRKLDGRTYTKILLDAPCSGEGMMTLDTMKDYDSWSVAHIRRLAGLQKQLIIEAWKLLAPGGTLVYSTCTMAPEENEAVVDYLLRKQPDATLMNIALEIPSRVPSVMRWNDREFEPAVAHTMRLQPSEDMEAFFVAKLTKSALPSVGERAILE